MYTSVRCNVSPIPTSIYRVIMGGVQWGHALVINSVRSEDDSAYLAALVAIRYPF